MAKFQQISLKYVLQLKYLNIQNYQQVFKYILIQIINSLKNFFLHIIETKKIFY